MKFNQDKLHIVQRFKHKNETMWGRDKLGDWD